MTMNDPSTVPLFGRDAELARIEAAFDETLRGEPILVWLCGEAGAGKSRSLAEVARRLGGRGFLTLQVRTPRGTTVDALLADLIRPFLLVPGHAERLRAELPADLRADLADLIPGARSAASARTRGRPVGPERRPVRSSRRLDALVGLLAWLAAKRPVALLLDDLHEAPDEICTHFRHLLVRARRAPLLIVAALRTDEVLPAKRSFAAELEAQHALLRVDLGPLNAGAIRKLVASLLDVRIGSEVGDWLTEVSRGNPLFAVEILRLLMEDGTIALAASADGGAWELRGALPKTVVPPPLATLVADRFARLSPDARSLAAALAVLDVDAPAAWIAGAAGLTSAQLRHGLSELAERHWVSVDSLGSASDPVRLTQPLARRVIYEGLSSKERCGLHARFARQWPMTDSTREQADAWFAQHAARSGDPGLRREALRPALAAGSSASAHGETTGAAALYEIALDLLSDSREKRSPAITVEALLGHAAALHECGRLEEAQSDLERAAELTRSHGALVSPLLETRVLRHLGDVRAGLGEFADGINLLEDAYRRAAPAAKRADRSGGADPALLEEAARAAIRLVFVNSQCGHFDRALAWGRRARGLVEMLQRPDLRGLLLNNMGLVYWSTGRLAEAARAFTRHLEIAGRQRVGAVAAARESKQAARGPSRESGRTTLASSTELPPIGSSSSSEIAYACSNLGLIYWNLGKIDEAERCYKQAIALHRAGGRLLSEAGSLQNYALLLEERGDYEGAARLNHQILDTVRRLGDRLTVTQVWGNLGGNYLELGRYEEARAYLDRARRDAEELGLLSTIPDILISLARLEIATDHPSAGRDLAAEAVRLARELRLPFDLGRSLRALGLAETALGSPRPALRHFTESAAVLTRIGAELEGAKSTLEEGLALARTRSMVAARRRVEKALAVFEAAGLAERSAAARAAAASLLPGITCGPRREESKGAVAAARTKSAKATGPSRAVPAATAPPDPAAPATPRPDVRIPEPAGWRIECFGPLRVLPPGDSEPISSKQWGSHKARQILAYILAVDPVGRGVMRERIIAAVWPEALADTVGHTFHVTVSHLRRALSGSAPETQSPLVQEGGFYRLAWPGGVWVDTREFASALSRAGELEAAGQSYLAEAEHHRAAALVCGDFLHDIHFEWAEALRVRYRQDYLQTLRKLSRIALARWDFAPARDLAHRLLAEEPLDEAAHRIVIESLLGEDRRAEALSQYRYCARLLKRELGTEPSGETTALLGRKVR
jgi:DNA-binding SARP family transcriptional activator/Flp pilus assembly protein TadD